MVEVGGGPMPQSLLSKTEREGGLALDAIRKSHRFAALPMKRQQALHELISTELAFVIDLSDMRYGYHDAIPEMTMSWEEKALVFGNIEELLEFHRKLSVAMVQCAISQPAQIGECFLGQRFIDVYSVYCSNYPRAVRSLELCKENDEIAGELERCKGQLEHTLPLDNLLLKPVQRVMKYHLLLEEQVKTLSPQQAQQHDPAAAPPPPAGQGQEQGQGQEEGPVGQEKKQQRQDGPTDDSEGRAKLLEASSLMKDVASRINRLKRDRELRAFVNGDLVISKLPSLRNRLVGLNCEFSALGHLLDEQPEVLMSTKRPEWRKSQTTRHLFLFRTMLLACKNRPDGSLSVKAHLPLQMCAFAVVDEHAFQVTCDLLEGKKVFGSMVLDAKAWVASMEHCKEDAGPDTPSPVRTSRGKTMMHRLLRRKPAKSESTSPTLLPGADHDDRGQGSAAVKRQRLVPQSDANRLSVEGMPRLRSCSSLSDLTLLDGVLGGESATNTLASVESQSSEATFDLIRRMLEQQESVAALKRVLEENETAHAEELARKDAELGLLRASVQGANTQGLVGELEKCEAQIGRLQQECREHTETIEKLYRRLHARPAAGAGTAINDPTAGDGDDLAPLLPEKSSDRNPQRGCCVVS